MKNKSPFNFDISKKYIIPMIPKGKRRTTLAPNCIRVECDIELQGRTVHITHPDYEDVWIVDDLFDWFLYTGEYKIKE